MLETIGELVRAALVLAGSALMVLGAFGILRLPDVYTRTQAASKTGTLGLALVFIAAAMHFRELAAVTKALAVVAFAFLSVPVAAHMISRAAHRAGLDPWPQGAPDDLRRADHQRPTPDDPPAG